MNLEIDMRMVGFEEMAEYLLYLYELGLLKPQTITDECKKELILYKDGHYYKRSR